jgi:predicted aspartyl protease
VVGRVNHRPLNGLPVQSKVQVTKLKMRIGANRRGSLIIRVLLIGLLVHADLTAPDRNVFVASGSGSYPGGNSNGIVTASDLETVTIPFELSGNHIYVRGRINGSEPLWFIIDSGASRSGINLKRAQELGLRLEGEHTLAGAAGAVKSARIRDVSFNLPGVDLTNLIVSAFALNDIELYAGRPVDVVLGHDLFIRFVVEIDYETRRMSLYNASGYRYRGRGETVPILLSRNQPWVHAEINLPGLGPIGGQFVIDTGAQCALMLHPGFARQQKVLESVAMTVATQATGVGGELPVKLGRIESFQWGSFVIHNPIALFPETEVGTFAGSNKAGNIGGAILRRFKLIFDYTRQRIILEPNRYFPEPEDFDMSGAIIKADSPNLKTIRVHSIIANSASAETGLRVGDVITAINNLPAEELGLAEIREMFKKQDRDYLLTDKRQQQLLNLRIKLRRLI